MARRQVVLCAGTIGSPHLLLLSGVGPRAELEPLGVPMVHDSPEVGHNLRDHAGVLMPFRVDRPSVNRYGSLPGMAMAAVQWLFGRGPAAAATAQAVGFHRIDDPHGRADLQFHFAPFSFDPDGKGGIALPKEPLVLLAPSLNHPTGAGRVALGSASADEPPVIRPRFLESDRDIATLAKGIRIVEQILATEPLARHVRGMVDPPPAEDAELPAFIRERAGPIYHPVGTCRMGTDPRSVVTPDLSVRGLDDLMVVDASVMPAHVSGNTHAAALMIGEKAASGFVS